MSNLDVARFLNDLNEYQEDIIKHIFKNCELNELDIDEDKFLKMYAFSNTKLLKILFKHMNITLDFSKMNKLKPTETTQTYNNKKRKKKKYKLNIQKSPDKPLEKKIHENDFIHFVDTCSELKLDYYRYNVSEFWQGPAIILDRSKFNCHKISKIKKNLNIQLVTDFLPDNHIAIYPQKKIDPNCIQYSKHYDLATPLEIKNRLSSVENIEVIEWNYNDHCYLLDKMNDTIYDSDTNIILGKRIYDYEERKWTIQNNN
jgi:hypothetical protein